MPSDSISDLWYLQPDQRDVGSEWLKGMQVGAQWKQQQIENRFKEEELRNQAIRIRAAAETALAKQVSDAQKANGFAEINAHLANVAENKAWADPKAEAEFWRIAGKYPHVIDHNELDSIYKNTFLAAQQSTEKAREADLRAATQTQIAESRSRDINRRIDVIEKAGATREEDKMAIAEIKDATERARIATTHEDRMMWQNISMDKLAAYEGLQQQKIIESQARTQAVIEKAKSLSAGLDAGQRAKMNIEFKAIEDRFIYGTGKGRMTPEQHEKAIDDLIDKYTPDSELLPPGSPPHAGAPVAPATAPPTPSVGTKTLTEALARDFLKKAGGDKEKARQLAREAGYVF